MFGVFRHVLVDKIPDIQTPINRAEKLQRIEKETFAYKVGGEANLTPKLLYSFENGVICDYVEGTRALDLVKENPQNIWNILSQIVKIYAKLHQFNITHLDATLKNCILDKRDSQFKIYDFEYYARHDIDFELQCAYDYVRIIEHTLRVLENYDEKKALEFVYLLKEIIPNEVKNVDFTIMRRYIRKIDKLVIYDFLKKKYFIIYKKGIIF